MADNTGKSLLDELAAEIQAEKEESDSVKVENRETGVRKLLGTDKSFELVSSSKTVTEKEKEIESLEERLKSCGLGTGLKKAKYDLRSFEELVSGRLLLPLPLILRNPPKNEKTFSTVGVLFDMKPSKLSKKTGKSFCIWKLSNLSASANMELPLFLFKDSVKLDMNKNLKVGKIVLVTDARMLDASSICIDRKDQMIILGEAPNFSFCESKNCGRIIISGKNSLKFCQFHLTQACQQKRNNTPMFSGALAFGVRKRVLPGQNSNQFVLNQLKSKKLKIRKFDPNSSKVSDLKAESSFMSKAMGKSNSISLSDTVKNISSVNWKKLSDQKSKYKESAEDKRFEILAMKLKSFEEKENISKQMETVTEINVAAFVCKECKTLMEKPLERCKEQNHSLKKFKVKKRFFSCSHCGNRTSILKSKYPLQACFKCRSQVWRKCSMYNTSKVLRN